MRYDGQLHRTPRRSRVPARDDHGAPRCVGRDGRMRPRMQRALGASDASAARHARTHAAHATRVAPYVRHARRRRSVLRMKGARHARSHGPNRRRPTATSDGDLRFHAGLCRAARASHDPPNGDLRRRPPFHVARCRAARAAFATSGVADNQKLRFPVTIFRVGVKL